MAKVDKDIKITVKIINLLMNENTGLKNIKIRNIKKMTRADLSALKNINIKDKTIEIINKYSLFFKFDKRISDVINGKIFDTQDPKINSSAKKLDILTS